jgi:hypothetical protein
MARSIVIAAKRGRWLMFASVGIQQGTTVFVRFVSFAETKSQKIVTYQSQGNQRLEVFM